MNSKKFRHKLLKKIKIFQKDYQNDKNLQREQKDNLDNFLNRTIEYCKTGKVTIYQKEGWYRGKETKIKNNIQYNTYMILYFKVKNIIEEIGQSEELETDEKIELKKCLQYLLAHIIGKLNAKIVIA